MRFSAPSTELQKVLGSISGVIPAKSTLPILENFLFEVTGKQLRITATDLDTSMSIILDVKDSESGKIAVPSKRLFETVRSLPSVDVTFVADPENSRVTMSTATGEYKLTGESSENYPSVPSFKGTEELDIESDVLGWLIGKTLFAVSVDELRPAMMGVLFQVRNGEIAAVATDGHRLVRAKHSSSKKDIAAREIIIPRKALDLVLKASNDAQCKLSLSLTHAMFSLGESTLVTRLIEEKYPNYESVIPLDNDKKLLVDRGQLLSSVRRTSLYASSTTRQVRLSVKKDSITVSAEDIDFGSEARETLTCDYNSDAMEIGYNSQYIIDVLSHVDTDEVSFLISSPTRASIVQPSSQREGEDLLMLIMPVRLNS